MDVMKRLTRSSLKMNKKRTIVTIIGIVLATALITAVSTLASSFQWSLIAYERETSGDFHVKFEDVPKEELSLIENNRNVERYFETAEIGYAPLEGSVNEDKPYLYIEAMDAAAMENATVHLVEGRLPENDSELLISKHMKTNGGVYYQVGDTMTLDIGARRFSEGASKALNQNDAYAYEDETLETAFTKTYTIVGVTERLSYELEPRTAPGYTVITGMNRETMDAASIYVTYTKAGLKNRLNVTASILQIDPQILAKDWSDAAEMTEEEWKAWGNRRYSYQTNQYLIYYETLDFSDSTLSTLYGIAIVIMLIIVFASAFCIRNSFAISITEKMAQYGMLASVGATPKQIRKNVFYEAFLLSIIGIPIGILSGVGACWVVIRVISSLLAQGIAITLMFHFAWFAIAGAAVLALVMIYLSAAKPARQASKVSPIVAMNGSSDIKIHAREVKAPKLIKKLFGMGGSIAYKNMKRNRKKYRVSVVSIAVSVMVFVSLYSFMNLAFSAADYYINDTDYNLQIHIVNMQKQYAQLTKLVEEDGVENATIMRHCIFNIPDEKLLYTEEMLQFYRKERHPETATIQLISLGENQYRAYLKTIGVSYEEAKDQAILINQAMVYNAGKENMVAIPFFTYEKGAVLIGTLVGKNAEIEQEYAMTLAAVTNAYPYGIPESSLDRATLVVSDEWMDKQIAFSAQNGSVYLQCESADAMQDRITKEYSLDGCSFNNIEQTQRQNKAMYTVVAIFIYGFIIVIALIGITNIFNTITTSMELRSAEFAMLRSVGMTNGEFNQMIRLESMFYGTKALVYGLFGGILCSYLIYYLMVDTMDMGYQLPVVGILISIAVVALLLGFIMQYSTVRIRRQNIIETIRQKNI